MTDNLLTHNDEIWKPIIGFENYECTIDGRVRNIKSSRILSLRHKNRNKFYTLSGKQISRTRCIELSFPEKIQTHNCLTCNIAFNRGFGTNYNYCSNECAPGDKKEYAKARKEKYNKKHGIEKKIRVKPITTCYECGNSFEGKTKYCCPGCQKAEATRNREAKEHDRIKRISEHKCKTCECSLTNLKMKYCDECRAVAYRDARLFLRRKQRGKGLDDKGKARKRARKYGVLYEPVKPIDVFNKTKGKCHICKRKLRWEDRGKNLDGSPEIDHLFLVASAF